MTDIQGLRAQLRDSRNQPAVRSSGGGGGIPFWLMAAVAGAVGFAIVLLTPRFYTSQRTAALPVSQGAQGRAEPAESAQAGTEQAVPAPTPANSVPAQAAPPPSAVPQPAPAVSTASPPPAAVSRYAGKAPEEVVRISDAVCEHRALVVRNSPVAPPRPPASAAARNERDKAQAKQVADDLANGPKLTAADEKLHCLLTEAPSRFCAPNQKRKATADIINYFKGIEYTNTALAVAARVQSMKSDRPPGPGSVPVSMLGVATVDQRVVDAIEGLMRAGYLLKAHRDEIGANVPAEIKQRLARVIGSTPPCPKPPWWAAWL